MSTNWIPLFADPNLDPKALLPLLDQTGLGLSVEGNQARHYFQSLWENPAFALAALELPELGGLSPLVESAWIGHQQYYLNEEIAAVKVPNAKERILAHLTYVFDNCQYTFAPFLQVLWSGRNRFPLFLNPYGSAWPQEQWWTLLDYNRWGEISTLEDSAARALVPLQYDIADLWVLQTAIRAEALVGCARMSKWKDTRELSLPRKRLRLAVDRHLLAHLSQGVPLDWTLLRAMEVEP